MLKCISLKSRLLREGDPWQVDISKYKIPLVVNQTLYERDLLNFRRKYSTVVNTSEIAAQDMATLTCVSENPRFNKEHITVRVGMGLFSKELENQIIGWKPGQTGTVTVKGQPVNVTVEDIRRENLPEVDDALAVRCDDPYIRAAEDIHAYCKGKQFDSQLDGPLDEAFPYLMRKVIEESEFELDPDEERFSQELTIRQFASSSMLGGRDLDSISEKEFSDLFGIAKKDLLSNLRVSGVYTLQCALLGQAMLERMGKMPTDDDYNAYLNRFIDMGASEEQARQEHPVIEYLLNEVGGFFMDETEALTLRRLKEGCA